MIIREDANYTQGIITESKSGNTFIEGIFLQADVKNRNGRIYPMKVVESAVARYDKDYIQTGRAIGQLGHPPGGQIDLHLASHKIESLRSEGTNFIGRAKILETPMGNIAKALIKDGVKLGVSLRGFGSLTEKNGARYVGEDFVLSTVDIVADPSAPDAFVTGIMENSQQFLNDGELLQEQFDYIKHSVSNMTSVQLSEGELLNMFQSFINTVTFKNI